MAQQRVPNNYPVPDPRQAPHERMAFGTRYVTYGALKEMAKAARARRNR